MKVYAESNLVLELLLEQEQSASCRDLVTLAEQAKIELALPAYALLEPYQTIDRRAKDRSALARQLAAEQTQLVRTASLAHDAAHLQHAVDLLVRASQDSFTRFTDIREVLLRVAELLVVDAQTLGDAGAAVTRFGLDYPDAVMLAAVHGDASSHAGPSVFLNRNARDFLDPDVKSYLGSVHCDIIPSFDAGLKRIQHDLGI